MKSEEKNTKKSKERKTKKIMWKKFSQQSSYTETDKLMANKPTNVRQRNSNIPSLFS